MPPDAQRQITASVKEVTFKLDGLPKPKERPRTVTRETTNADGVTSRRTVTITPADTKAFEAEVKLVSAQARKKVSAELLPGLLRVEVWVFCSEDMARADMDNIHKAILDGMEGAVYANDNKVDSGEYIRDRFHTGRPYAMVRVTPFVPPSRR